MGRMAAARAAGYTPKNTPIATETPSANGTEYPSTIGCVPLILNWAPIKAATTPNTPPRRVRVAASTRNCPRIAERVAPRL